MDPLTILLWMLVFLVGALIVVVTAPIWIPLMVLVITGIVWLWCETIGRVWREISILWNHWRSRSIEPEDGQTWFFPKPNRHNHNRGRIRKGDTRYYVALSALKFENHEEWLAWLWTRRGYLPANKRKNAKRV